MAPRARGRRLTAFRTRTYPCGRCQRALTEAQRRGQPVLACEPCGAVFVDEPTLATLYHEASGGRRMPALLEHADGEPRVPCPACHEEMERVWVELIALDRCPRDGVFLDGGELEAVLAHAARGPADLGRSPAEATERQLEALGFLGIRPPPKAKG